MIPISNENPTITGDIIDNLCEEIAPEVKFEFVKIVNKVNNLRNTKQDKVVRANEIIDQKLEAIDTIPIGELWVISECPDIHSIPGRSWLIGTLNKLSTSNLYKDYEDELLNELKKFIFKFDLLYKLREWKESVKNEFPKERIPGFETNLNLYQIKELFDKSSKYWDATLEEFTALLTGKLLPEGSLGLTWKILNRFGKPHKGTLGEYFRLLKITPKKRIFLAFIIDRNGNPLEPGKKSGKKESGHYDHMKEIIESIIIPT